MGNFRPTLVDQILGKPCRPFQYVGGDRKMPPPLPHALHKIDTSRQTHNNKDYFVVTIRLFSNLGFPECIVVAGEA